MTPEQISAMIDASPMNRGLVGADWVADERNVFIGEGSSAIMFDYEQPGVYQFHWLASPGGRAAIDRAKSAIARMFDEFGAQAIYGFVPLDRRDVRIMIRLVGARHVGTTQTEDGPCQIFIITADMREGNKQ